MQAFTLAAITDAEKNKLRHKNITKSMDRKIQVKVSRSRCMIEGYVKDSYYARFHTRSYL